MFLSRWLPGLANLLHYRREWFHADLQAGLSVAAIQIPIAIAYAQIVGCRRNMACTPVCYR